MFLAVPSALPSSLVADTDTLFFTIVDDPTTESRTVQKVPASGGSTTELPADAYGVVDKGADLLGIIGAFVMPMANDGFPTVPVSAGLDRSEYFLMNQDLALAGPDIYYTSFGTINSSGLECCRCGGVLRVPQVGSMNTPQVVWSGEGRSAMVSSDGGAFIATADINNGQILILSPPPPLR